jgi:beta-N-acetylhexosaminidase
MADQQGEAGKGTVLDELRAVHWSLALALFAGGAALTAILLLLVIGGGGSGATVKQRPSRYRVRIGAGGTAATGRRSSPRREAESPPAERLPRPTIPALVGQRFMVGLRGVGPTAALLSDVRKGEVGGLVLFPEGALPAATAAAVARLQRAARVGDNPPLLIATDQEGGPVRRFESGPPSKPLSALSPQAAFTEGERTAIFLHRCGVNVDLAPVVDLGLRGSFIAEQGRTISSDPNEVTAVALQFVHGLESNVMPVAKHFPGLGGASTNTDEGKSVVESGLRASLMPYEALIGSEVPAIMLSTAIYTTVDESNGAAWSRRIVAGLLRHRLGFRGLTISDDLSSKGVAASLPVAQAFVDSARAGVDVLMAADPDSFRDAHDAVLAAARAGRISGSNLISSYDRILTAKERYAR